MNGCVQILFARKNKEEEKKIEKKSDSGHYDFFKSLHLHAGI
jgi:hypothetical protein